MYKIITDISILTALNEAASQKENNPEVKYCEENKHCNRNEWAIPIIEPILIAYKLPFIDELLHGLVESLPESWSWHFEDRPIRISIPLYIQSTALTYTESEDRWLYLKDLVLMIRPVIEEFTLTDKENVTIYLEELFPEHMAILEMFEEIKIEVK